MIKVDRGHGPLLQVVIDRGHGALPQVGSSALDRGVSKMQRVLVDNRSVRYTGEVAPAGCVIPTL